ncbi:hypothetical protein RJT34_07911 [Clitoria ternatea]|uniref:Glycosyl hydrolase family 95 catalytic domain-containing protein n=1 Tax=Clitoria ternatea TaxID=43366 RepID=A0AAN9K3X1_CLITE
MGKNIDRSRWALWPIGGAWLCTHLWEHYAYKLDEAVYLLNSFLGSQSLRGELRLNNYTKFSSLVDLYLMSSGKSKLPLGTIFKPQTSYECSLGERCKGFPETVVNLLKTLLSIDPFKRETTSSALMSKYFSTKPYACDPSILPKFPPSKEMDAKSREDIHRQVNDFKDLDVHHRHLSHLFGLFPGHTITLKETPALFEAAEETFINKQSGTLKIDITKKVNTCTWPTWNCH